MRKNISLEQLRRMINASQAAAILDRSSERVRQLVRCGKISALQTAHGLLFNRDEIEAFRRQRDSQSGVETGR